MLYYIGMDMGSSFVKAVLVSADNLEIVNYAIEKTGYDFKLAGQRVMEKLLANYKLADVIMPIYSCGYGREQLPVNFVPRSEITALTRAVFQKYQKSLSIIDIGGQDTKYIQVNGQGIIDKFNLNRKCAAGTGSFIEEISSRLAISIDEFPKLADKSKSDLELNSFCTVFAISEIVGLIKQGIALHDIIKAVYKSIVRRLLEQVSQDCKFLIVTGGVPKHHPAIIHMLREQSQATIMSPSSAQFITAYGAVLLHLTEER